MKTDEYDVVDVWLFAKLSRGDVVELFTVEDAAKLANKSVPTIYNWIKQNKFKTVNALEQKLIIKSEFLKFIAK